MAHRRGGLDRRQLLAGLQPIEYTPSREDSDQFEHASLAQALLNMVGVDQDSEYQLCRRTAEHLLGRVPELTDFDPWRGANHER